MQKNLVIIGAIALTLLVYWYFSGENAFTAPARTPKAAPLTFEIAKLEKHFGDCPAPDQRCLTVKLEYPVAQGGVDSAREAINRVIRENIIGSLQLGDQEINLDMHIDTALADLADEYRDYLEDLPDFGMGWELETTGQVMFQNDSVLSVSMSNYAFTGGAHPNSYLSIYNFDPRSGRRLGWTDFVPDTLAFKKIAEAEFRKIHELKPADNLEDAGFWFPDNRFTLPANYGRTAEGIYLFYNAYEIAPYVVGPTDMTIKQ